MSARRALYRFLSYLFAPGLCYACGVELEDSTSLCASCSERLLRVPQPCAACGEPNPAPGALCPRCLRNPPRWQRLLAPYQYRGLARQYLLQLKFDDAQYLARTLCEHALPAFTATPRAPEVLLPVPLHPSRLLARGYNQAAEIAAVLSTLLELPLDRRALRRVRATASQSGLSALQRKANLRNAFAYRPRRRYRHVALVDDIVTSGATAGEITRLLHHHGVEFVEVWALARVYHR